MKKSILHLACILIGHAAMGQGLNIVQATKLLIRDQSQNKATTGETYTANLEALASVFGTHQKIELDGFPLGNGTSGDLLLCPARTIDQNTQYFIGNTQVTAPDMAAYTGYIKGQAGSRVFVSVFAGTMLVNLETAEGHYVIAPLNTEGNRFVLTAENNLFGQGKMPLFSCSSGDIYEHPASLDKTAGAANQLLKVDVAAEADSTFYARAGGTPAKVFGYIASLFSMVSMYYENEIGVTLHLSWVKAWDKNDPYQVKGNAYALSTPVQAYWQKNYTTVPRNIAHVMTSSSNGSGGFGWIGVVCDTVYGYSVSGPTCSFTYPDFSFNYDAYIVAHELGHNFGGQHTYTCFYGGVPIDTCGTKDDGFFAYSDACLSKPITARPNPGSFMSYCGNTNYKYLGVYTLRMTFLPAVAAVMRASVSSKACVAAPTAPTVILTAPRGDQASYNGTSLPISWLYANVTEVNLDYSTDNGKNWVSIANSIAATAQAYAWDISKLNMVNAWVRITQSGNNAVGDTSLATIDIKGQSGISVPTQPKEDIRVFPNPANSVVTVTGISGMDYSWQVMDMLGRKVLEENHVMPGSCIIDVSSLPSGNYSLTLISGMSIFSKKIMVFHD